MGKKLQNLTAFLLALLLAGGVVCAGESEPPSEIFSGDVSGNDVSGNNMPENNVSGNNLSDNDIKTVLSVKVPKSLDFVLDPYELKGQGSIWSPEYSFVNEGNSPVKIYLSRLHCTVADNVAVTAGAELIDGSGKQAVLWLHMDNGDVVGITERDSSYEITLNPQEALNFWVNGKISTDNQWESGDIRLSVLYRLEAQEE